MLLLLLISVIILSITLSLHYHQHFIFHVSICTAKSQSLSVITNDIRDNTSPQRANSNCQGSFCLCALKPKHDEDSYDFFPSSFLYYLLFLIFLCLLIIVIDITDYSMHHHTVYYDILFDYSHPIHVDKPLSTLNSIDLSNAHEACGWMGPFIKTLDYILIHSVMLLFVWESLFSFYKYYTTNAIIRTSEIMSTQAIASRFVVYGATFVVLFIGQMHLYYYLWPMLVLSHCIFNLACTIMFSSMLIGKYRLFIAMDGGVQRQAADDVHILHSIYAIRALSVTCIILQSLYLALFTILYTVNTIYYLPILWSISACIYSLNFVRNRRYLGFKRFQIKQKFKSKVSEPFTHQTNAKSLDIKHTHATKHSQSNRGDSGESRMKFSVVKVKSLTIDTECEVHNSRQRTASTVSTSMLEAGAMHESNDVRCTDTRQVVRNTKALKLLGLSSIRQPVARKTLSQPFIPPKIVRSQSDVIVSPPSANQMAIVYSKTAPNTCIVPVTLEMNASEIEMDYMPRSQLRCASSPSLPMEFFEQRASLNPNIRINMENIEYVDDEEDDQSCVFVNYATAEKQFDKDISNRNADDVDVACETKVNEPKSPYLSHPKLVHRKSSSDPVGMNDSSLNLNMHEVMESLDLFAKYGFCSRNSINSLYQLTNYRNKRYGHQITFHQSIK
eukprot:333240_1